MLKKTVSPFTEAGFFSLFLPQSGDFGSLQMKGLWVGVSHNGPLLRIGVCSLMKIGRSETVEG